MDYHLTPRPRGMEILLNNMFNYLDAVYDVTIVFGDGEGRCLDKKQAMPGLFCMYLSSPYIFSPMPTKLPQMEPHAFKFRY